MATPNSQILSQARAALSGKWGRAVITFFIYFLVLCAVSCTGIGVLIGGPLALGAAIFSLNIVRGREAETGQIFRGFDNFVNAMAVFVLMVVIVTVGLLLFVIPGIIAAYMLSMSIYVLADHPDMSPTDVLRTSRSMMDGYKLKLFTLQLRFVLLAILCTFTLGIGYLWLIPYMQVTQARFYDDLKAAREQGTVVNEINSIQ
ncbi:MAG: DUF975 family protein [Bacteroidetes bacterium]|nr:DUF975 family protein [Bacteroidota bacterium]